MTKKIEILLDSGDVLDVASEFGMGIDYSIEDIIDPSKRKSSFTKTIILTGTKNNNKIFGYLFDVNSDFTYFNPSFKTDCKIVVDGTVILDGFLQLKKIDKQASGDLIHYEVVVYQEAADFFSSMGENFISDIDFSELDHTYNGTDIGNSWVHTYEDGYVYPLFYKNSRAYTTQDFKPSIFLRYYLDKIASENGFTLGGSFMNNDLMNSEIIPFNGDEIKVSDANLASRQFEARTAGAHINSFSKNNIWSDTNSFALVQLTDDAATDPSNIWNTTTNTWTVNTTGQYSLPVQLGYAIIMTAPSNTWLRQDSTGNGDTPLAIWLEIQAFKNGVPFGSPIKSSNNSLPYNEKDSGGVRQPAFGTDNGTIYTLLFDVVGTAFSDELLDVGDEITFVSSIKTSDRIVYANDAQAVAGLTGHYIFTPATVNIGINLYIRNQLSDGNSLTKINNVATASYLADHDAVEMNQFIIQKTKQKDLFKDLTTRYNLMITTDPNNSKKLLLETRDNYYADAPVLDWTDKKDWNYNDSIQLLSELQTKKIQFTYKKGNDEWSKNYFNGTKTIYGEKEIVFANEIVKGVKKIESIFASVPLIYNSIHNEIVVPAIDTKKPKNNITVLQWGGLIDCLDNKTWVYNGFNSGGNPITATHTDYPYCGHWNNPFEPTVDNHFNSILTLENGDVKIIEWYNELSATTNNSLYNAYWANYVNQIDDGELVTMRLNLSENDINNIKDNFNTSIFIDKTYYNLSLIQDYDPTKDDGLTIVKLLKTKGATTFSPDNVPNTDPTELDTDTNSGTQRPANNNTGGALTTIRDADSNIQSEQSLVVGENNIIYGDSANVAVVGEDNIIESSVTNSGILGSVGSTIGTGINGSWIIGINDKIITRDNEIWLGNLHIVDGTIISQWNTIEGGENELGWPNLFGTSFENLIEGGDNELRSSDYTNIINLVDGGFSELVTSEVSAPFTPLSIDGLTVWLDPSDSDNYLLDGFGNYETLTDKTGNGNDFTQGTSGNRATPGTENGLSYMNFDGTNDRYASTQSIDLSNTAALTIFFAGQHNDSTSGIIYEHSSNFNSTIDGLVMNIDGSSRFAATVEGNVGYNQKLMDAPDTAPLDTNELYVSVYDKSESLNEIVNIYKNGVIQSTSHSLTANNTNNFGDKNAFIGSRGNGTVGIADIKLYEFLIFDRVLTSDEITQVNNYLNRKWKLY